MCIFTLRDQFSIVSAFYLTKPGNMIGLILTETYRETDTKLSHGLTPQQLICSPYPVVVSFSLLESNRDSNECLMVLRDGTACCMP